VPKKKRTAADIIADLENSVGGVTGVTDVTDVKLGRIDDFSASLRAALRPSLPSPITTISHPAPAPAGCATLVASPFVSEADLDRVASCLGDVKSDVIDRSSIDCFNPPSGFSATSELLLHPLFVRHTIRLYGCVYVLDLPSIIRRIRVGLEEEEEEAPQSGGKAEADRDFFLKPDWYHTLSMLIARGSTVLLIGPAGSGKTQAVEQVFKDRKQRLEIVSCTPRTTANDLEGATDLVYENGQQITQFTPASPAIASEKGYGLLLDEADAAPSEAMYSMYRLLDGKPMHIVRKGYDGEVPYDSNVRIIGTQNTEGRGDDRGLYHGRSYQDEAFLDRWNAVIRVDYPSKENETLILRKRTAISGADAEKIVDAAIALRNSQLADEIMFTCTMRRTLAVAENIAAGLGPLAAWSLAAINRATTEDRAKIPEILNRIYGSTKLRSKQPRKNRGRPVIK